MSKIDRAVHGPGWGEVILGAVLSLILGIALGAILLILRPVVVAKELPKEPVPGKTYFVEGQRGDVARGKAVLARREALARGEPIRLTEADVNGLILALAPATPAAKPGAPAAAPSNETLAAGTPNVRIRDGVVQIGVPVTVNALGFQQKLIAQARGGFVKRGDVFVYDPSEIYLGSCPVQRLPFLASYVRRQVAASQSVPEDVVMAWSRLTRVTVEKDTLVLAMQ
ncbi:hypothetical protein [Opitutus sp. ER46]|uniref:hypothetical protein n=1 Tax=Opitutus sp. ER46 TaxID=2161864 RepID=UPI000D323670|nr:hypothetical protein [Opitutus sp. ER46]PTX90772.1 hypothetical protein DB354_19135 [Opitutus sp. ER46]